MTRSLRACAWRAHCEAQSRDHATRRAGIDLADIEEAHRRAVEGATSVAVNNRWAVAVRKWGSFWQTSVALDGRCEATKMHRDPHSAWATRWACARIARWYRQPTLGYAT